MQIEQKQISEIIPYAQNAKKHPKEQIQKIAASIKEFGFLNPIIIDKNNVCIAGHGRLEAAKEIGMIEVPVLRAEHLTEQQIKVYRIADNRLAESEWDMDLVIEELRGLDEPLIDLTGFDTDFLIAENENDDIVPEIPEEPKSKLGDLYILGPHRVLCGDSSKIKDIEKLMDGKKADMSFTSPPYNVGHNLGYKGKNSKYENSIDDLDNYADLIIKSTQISIIVSKEVFVNIQFLANNKKDILIWLYELSDKFKDIFFWKKLQVQPAMAENIANSQTEIIVLFGQNNNRTWGNKKWRGNFNNLIEINSASRENKNSKIHNATFPVAIPIKFITHAYLENSIILDQFLGTGTTMIACEKSKRICYGMELDPLYIDTIVSRYVQFTGNTQIIKNGEKITWQV